MDYFWCRRIEPRSERAGRDFVRQVGASIFHPHFLIGQLHLPILHLIQSVKYLACELILHWVFSINMPLGTVQPTPYNLPWVLLGLYSDISLVPEVLDTPRNVLLCFCQFLSARFLRKKIWINTCTTVSVIFQMSHHISHMNMLLCPYYSHYIVSRRWRVHRSSLCGIGSRRHMPWSRPTTLSNLTIFRPLSK